MNFHEWNIQFSILEYYRLNFWIYQPHFKLLQVPLRPPRVADRPILVIPMAFASSKTISLPQASSQQSTPCSLVKSSHSGVYTTTHLQRVSTKPWPKHTFWSPCVSPVSNRYLLLPSGIRSPNYYRQLSTIGTPSPTQTLQFAALLIKVTNFEPAE